MKYMQEWEEKIIEKREARQEGQQLGRIQMLKEQIQKKLEKGKDIQTIADELEEAEEVIRELIE